MSGLEHTTRSAVAVAAAARRRGATVAVVRAGTRAAFYDAIARELRLPDWFGRNLDALRDVLTDLSWLPVGEVVVVWDGRPEDAALRAVLADAATASTDGPHPLRIVVTAAH